MRVSANCCGVYYRFFTILVLASGLAAATHGDKCHQDLRNLASSKTVSPVKGLKNTPLPLWLFSETGSAVQRQTQAWVASGKVPAELADLIEFARTANIHLSEIQGPAQYALESGFFVFAKKEVGYRVHSFTENTYPPEAATRWADGKRPTDLVQTILYLAPPSPVDVRTANFCVADFYYQLSQARDHAQMLKWATDGARAGRDTRLFGKHVRSVRSQMLLDKDLYKLYTLSRAYRLRAQIGKLQTGKDQTALIAELALEHLKKVAGNEVLSRYGVTEANVLTIDLTDFREITDHQ